MMSTIKAINVQHPSSSTINLVNDSSGNVAVGGTVGMASSFNRNILINGNFLINQRVYVSGTATAAGTYMHDRWKSTQTGSYYTFTQGTPDTTITIVAGAIAQIVENVNVAGGVYTLSWTGTATARVAINGASTTGSYAASPITTASATAGQQITVEFVNGTLGLVQLEPGTKATTYERQIYSDQLTQCQRYYEKSYAIGTAPGAVTAYSSGTTSGVNGYSSSIYVFVNVPFKVTKRTAATIAYWDAVGNANRTTYVTGGGLVQTDNNSNVSFVTGSEQGAIFSPLVIPSYNCLFNWTASAEL